VPLDDVTIEINAMAYSPVADELEEDDDDFWQVSTRDMSVDQEILDIFRSYLVEIIEKSDTNQVSIGKFPDDSRSQEYLDDLLELDLEVDQDREGYDELEEVAQSLGRVAKSSRVQ
jgi:hypothetical protein